MINNPEISIVIPCLNEEKSIGLCIDKIVGTIQKNSLKVQLIIVDNNSTDKSRQIINEKISSLPFAIVVTENRRGYGSAYLAGLKVSTGTYIFLADADDTYDFRQVTQFVDVLKNGADFVIGDRFKGKMHKDSMSFARRYIGNPILSGTLRLLFSTKINDAHCGMRAMTREAFEKMNPLSFGMEFASEMIVKALKAKLIIKEISVSYTPRIGKSKLNPLRDGLRHIKYMCTAYFYQ